VLRARVLVGMERAGRERSCLKSGRTSDALGTGTSFWESSGCPKPPHLKIMLSGCRWWKQRGPLGMSIQLKKSI